MTKVFKVNYEPYYEELPLVFHNNGTRKDGTPRKRKVLVKAKQGMVNAKHYYYAMYHPELDGTGVIMPLNGNDTDMSKDNLILMSKRQANNIVHFNNSLYFPNNKELQEIGNLIAEAIIKGKELENERKNN